MSDMTDDFYTYDLHVNDTDPFETVRKRLWGTKTNSEVRVCDMTDKHLLNAFNLSKDEALFREMVWRLFKQHLKDTQS